MIDPIKEQVIREMVKQGVSKRLIAKQLKVARNTVARVLESATVRPAVSKESSYDRHIGQVRELFRDCQGNVVRVQEELLARYNITIPYQSLTWPDPQISAAHPGAEEGRTLPF